MLKKITALAILGGICINSGAFAYTSTDVDNANYLATRNIIRNWSTSPENYKLDSRVSRVDVIGMALAMVGITKNSTCRGDFSDIDMSSVYADWACRTVETAADHNLINAQTSITQSLRKVRPYKAITRSEALGIFMNAFPADQSAPGYAYYLNSNFPVDGGKIGYTSAYNFGAPWQASVFYSYIRTVLNSYAGLQINPRANEEAKLREVFEFARNIMK